MKQVVSVSLGSSRHDFEFTARFLGRPLRVRRLGTNGSAARAEKLLRQCERSADVIGLGVLKDRYKVGDRRFIDAESARLKAVVTEVPVTTGRPCSSRRTRVASPAAARSRGASTRSGR